MNKKKSIALAIILLLILLIGGMLAYFTDTDTKTNEFTLGDDVEISLTETWNAEDGIGFYPGAEVTKAPAIKNDSSTTPAYVFAEIVVPCYDKNGDDTVETPLFTFTPNTGWTLVKTSAVNPTDKTITYVYAYGTSESMTSLNKNSTTSTAVFSKVVLDPTLTSAQKATASATPNIIVNAYGIQTTGLSTNVPLEIFDLF